MNYTHGEQTVRVLRKKSGFLFGTKSGFSLIELAIVVAILGILAFLTAPLVMRRSVAFDTTREELNGRLLYGASMSMRLGQKTRVLFDLEKNIIRLESAVADKADTFAILESGAVSSEMKWPSELTIHRFFIEGKDELAGSFATKKVWFFINAQGISQQVELVVYDEENGKSERWKINPLTSQFEIV